MANMVSIDRSRRVRSEYISFRWGNAIIMSKIGVEVPKSYMHMHEKCTCSRCLMFLSTQQHLKLRWVLCSCYAGPPTAARFRVNVLHARFAHGTVTNLT